MAKKYTVTRIILFNETIEVEAENGTDAIRQAMDTPYEKGNLEYLDTDYYEIVDHD